MDTKWIMLFRILRVLLWNHTSGHPAKFGESAETVLANLDAMLKKEQNANVL